MESVQIRSFFQSVFSRTRSEHGPEKSAYVDTFHPVTIYTHLNSITEFEYKYLLLHTPTLYKGQFEEMKFVCFFVALFYLCVCFEYVIICFL